MGYTIELVDAKIAERAAFDYVTKTAVVHYKPERSVPADSVIEAVKAAGYSATPAMEKP